MLSTSFSLTYKVLTTSQPTYLSKLVTVQSPRSTRSSSVVTISGPPTSSSLKITNRSFQHAAPHLWNQLPHSFREPHPHLGLSPSHHPTDVGSTLSSHHFYHQSLLLFFTPDLKHTSPQVFSTIDFSIDTHRPDRFLLLIGFVLVLVLR